MIEINSPSRNREEIVASIARGVMRWQDATQDFDEAVGKRLDLNAAERRCLSFLFHGPQPAGAIAGATGLTPAAVTSLIDRLEKRGYVARSRGAADRRKVFVEMTEAANAATGRYYGPLAEAGGWFMKTFSGDELIAVERFLAGAIDIQERRLAEIEAEEMTEP